MIDLGPELPGGEFTFDVGGKITKGLTTNATRARRDILMQQGNWGLKEQMAYVGRVAASTLEVSERDSDLLEMIFRDSGAIALAAFTESDLDRELQEAVLCQLSGAPDTFLGNYDRHRRIASTQTSPHVRDHLLIDSTAVVTINHPEIRRTISATTKYFTNKSGRMLHGEFARDGFSYTAHLLDVATGYVQGIEMPEEALPELDLDSVHQFLDNC